MNELPGTQLKEYMIIDFKEPLDHILNYLYKVFNIPPVIIYTESHKIVQCLNNMIHYVVLNLNNKTEFLTGIQKLNYLEQISLEDVHAYELYKDDLQLLLMYLMNYLSGYLPDNDERVYILEHIHNSHITVTVHSLNKETNDLVFRP